MKKNKSIYINALFLTAICLVTVFFTTQLSCMGPDQASEQTLSKPEIQLLVAAQSGDTAHVTELLAAGVNINIQEPETRKTALMFAAQQGHITIVNQFIKAGADLHIQDRYGMTALMYAVYFDQEEICGLLIAAKADIHAKDTRGNSALIIAARESSEPILKMLLAFGANITAVNKIGDTPLIIASKYGNSTAAVLLIKQIALLKTRDNNTEHKTARKSASDQKKDSQTPDLLVSRLACAYVNLTNMRKQTALSYAAQAGHEEIVAFLLKCGAHISSRDKNSFCIILAAAKMGIEHTITQLITAGADINLQDALGRTPLMIAAENGYVTIVTKLIGAGADLDKQDNFGVTALMAAVQSDHIKIAIALISTDANVMLADVYGRTALSIARDKKICILISMLTLAKTAQHQKKNNVYAQNNNAKKSTQNTALAVSANGKYHAIPTK